MEAYIFVNSDPGMLWEVAEATLKIEGIKMAHAFTGQFDVVAYAEFANMGALGEIIERLHSLGEFRELGQRWLYRLDYNGSNSRIRRFTSFCFPPNL